MNEDGGKISDKTGDDPHAILMGDFDYVATMVVADGANDLPTDWRKKGVDCSGKEKSNNKQRLFGTKTI
jgi:hypothetical protein